MNCTKYRLPSKTSTPALLCFVFEGIFSAKDYNCYGIQIQSIGVQFELRGWTFLQIQQSVELEYFWLQAIWCRRAGVHQRRHISGDINKYIIIITAIDIINIDLYFLAGQTCTHFIVIRRYDLTKNMIMTLQRHWEKHPEAQRTILETFDLQRQIQIQISWQRHDMACELVWTCWQSL